MNLQNVNDGIEDLRRSWWDLLSQHATCAREIRATGHELIDCWAEPSRHYHTVTHLREVLRGVDQLGDHAANPSAVRLAAWYHDVIYRGRADDEYASAARAESDLTHLGIDPELVAEVGRLVRLTASHKPDPEDRNGQTLCDADLAILASPTERYARYTAAVRAEYGHVPEDEFRLDRAAVPRVDLDRYPPSGFRFDALTRTNER